MHTLFGLRQYNHALTSSLHSLLSTHPRLRPMKLRTPLGSGQEAMFRLQEHGPNAYAGLPPYHHRRSPPHVTVSSSSINSRSLASAYPLRTASVQSRHHKFSPHTPFSCELRCILITHHTTHILSLVTVMYRIINLHRTIKKTCVFRL